LNQQLLGGGKNHCHPDYYIPYYQFNWSEFCYLFSKSFSPLVADRYPFVAAAGKLVIYLSLLFD
jgi:hypothetical protein